MGVKIMAIFLGIVILIAAVLFVRFVKNPSQNKGDRDDF
jgi:hypothetical protein